MEAEKSSADLKPPLRLGEPDLTSLAAFQAELERRFPRLVLLCRFITHGPDAADDLAQEVIVAALKYRASYNPAYDLGAWLGGIARNLSKRRNYDPRTVPLFDALADEFEINPESAGAAISVEYESEMRALRACLEETSPANQKLVRMRYTEGLRNGEIAAELQIHEDAVRARLMRVRRALGRCIRKKTLNK